MDMSVEGDKLFPLGHFVPVKEAMEITLLVYEGANREDMIDDDKMMASIYGAKHVARAREILRPVAATHLFGPNLAE